MRIDVITIFPAMCAPVIGQSILQRAQEQGRVTIEVHDLRDYTHDKRRTVDDRPYGGGPGMVMKPEPIAEAIAAIESRRHGSTARPRPGCQVVLMGPGGSRLTQSAAKALSQLEHLLIVCGHYEGVDERVRQTLIDREMSIGDYVLTGGELPAMVLVDAVVRLIPGVLGHEDATVEESFNPTGGYRNGLLEYPQYTRPLSFQGMEVPDVLRSGDHERISTWRKLKAFARTLTHRPDLITPSHEE